jgi:hypothetical protein
MARQSIDEIIPETLRTAIASIGGVEMSDRELQDVLPIVRAQRELVLGIRHLEIDEQMGASRRARDE